jgi:t-SNARE complex subunit (syntaxin)
MLPRKDYEKSTLDEIADAMAAGPTAPIHDAAFAELQRRNAILAQQTTDAQIKASDAAIETARYTRDSSRWMFWSVIAILFTSGVQALFAVLTYLKMK